MRKVTFCGIIYYGSNAVLWIATPALPIITATLKADANKYVAIPAIFHAVNFVQANSWWMLFWLSVAAGVSTVLKKLVGPPWIWQLIHAWLDEFQKHAFAAVDGEDLHHHRVTLFRFHRWRWCCIRDWNVDGYLIPAERSGHTTRKSDTRFRIPRNPDEAEGVAGKTWSTFKGMQVSRLPNLENATDDTYIDYAERTFVKPDWLRTHGVKARSYWSIPIRVKGRPWGVIILDSRSDRAMEKNPAEFYDLMGRCLAKLLERA